MLPMLPLFVVLMFWAFMLIPLFVTNKVKIMPNLERTPLGPAAKAYGSYRKTAPILAPAAFWGSLALNTGETVYHAALPQAKKRKELLSRSAVIAENQQTTKWLRKHPAEDMQLYGVERALQQVRNDGKLWSLTVSAADVEQAYQDARDADPIIEAAKNRLPVFRISKDCKWCTWQKDPDLTDDDITVYWRELRCPDHGGEITKDVRQKDCPDCRFDSQYGDYHFSRTKPCWRHGGPPRPVKDAVAATVKSLVDEAVEKSVPKASTPTSSGRSRGGGSDPLKAITTKETRNYQVRVERVLRAREIRQSGRLADFPIAAVGTDGRGVGYRAECPACFELDHGDRSLKIQMVCTDHRSTSSLAKDVYQLLDRQMRLHVATTKIDHAVEYWAQLDTARDRSTPLTEAMAQRASSAWELLAASWDVAIGLEQLGPSDNENQLKVAEAHLSLIARRMHDVTEKLYQAERDGAHITDEVAQEHVLIVGEFVQLAEFLRESSRAAA